jgi:hypothetical protein
VTFLFLALALLHLNSAPYIHSTGIFKNNC